MMARLTQLCGLKGSATGPACAVKLIDFENLTRDGVLDVKGHIYDPRKRIIKPESRDKFALMVLWRLTRTCWDWLKFAQSETTGIKLLSKDKVQKMNAEFESIWQEAVEEEVQRRLAARGLTLEVQQANGNGRQSCEARDSLRLTTGVHR
jgi:hypothetical protein